VAFVGDAGFGPPASSPGTPVNKYPTPLTGFVNYPESLHFAGVRGDLVVWATDLSGFGPGLAMDADDATSQVVGAVQRREQPHGRHDGRYVAWADSPTPGGQTEVYLHDSWRT